VSTSGSTSWSLNRDEVINAALRKLAVLSGGSTPETFEITAAAQALNAMIKGFHADGMPVCGDVAVVVSSVTLVLSDAQTSSIYESLLTSMLKFQLIGIWLSEPDMVNCLVVYPMLVPSRLIHK